MKKSINSVIVWLLVILIPIVALAALPDEAHCPAVLRTGYHARVFDWGGNYVVDRIDAYKHYYHDFFCWHCTECTKKEKIQQDYSGNHEKGDCFNTYTTVSSYNGTYHKCYKYGQYWCSFHNFGCGANWSELISTSNQRHSCYSHTSLGPNTTLHKCRCGAIKYSAYSQHY